MQLTNSIFLNHAIPMLLLLQLSMEYYWWQKKKACKRRKRLQAKERLSKIVYHENPKLYHHF